MILAIDEGQNIPIEGLIEIGMISDLQFKGEPLIQIILVAHPSIKKKLQLEEVSHVAQRITISLHLRPMVRQEVGEYIKSKSKE